MRACTHLGSAAAEDAEARAEIGRDWPGGFYCPATGRSSITRARVPRRAGRPPQVPPTLRCGSRTVIGEDKETKGPSRWLRACGTGSTRGCRGLKEEWRKHAASTTRRRTSISGTFARSRCWCSSSDRLGISDDELQADASSRSARSLHHARRAGRLDHPLHPLDRRLAFSSSCTCTCSAPCCTARTRSRASWLDLRMRFYLTLMEAFFGYCCRGGRCPTGRAGDVTSFGTVPFIGRTSAVDPRDYVGPTQR